MIVNETLIAIALILVIVCIVVGAILKSQEKKSINEQIKEDEVDNDSSDI